MSLFPYWYNVIGGYLGDYHKTLLLHNRDIRILGDDDHHLERINDVLDLIGKSEPFDYLDNIRGFSYYKSSHPQHNARLDFDLSLKDVHRRYHSIKERYHKDVPSLNDIRLLSDGSTRLLRPMVRGYERHLFDSINYLDDEAVLCLSKFPKPV